MSFSKTNGPVADDLLIVANNALRDGVVVIDPSNEKLLTNWSLKPDHSRISKMRKELFNELTKGHLATRE